MTISHKMISKYFSVFGYGLIGFFSLMTLRLDAQDAEPIPISQVVEKLSVLRSNLLEKDENTLSLLKAIFSYWMDLDPDIEKTDQSLTEISHAIRYYEYDYKLLKTHIKYSLDTSSLLVKQFDKQQYNLIKENGLLTFLMYNQIIEPVYPFIINLDRLEKEMGFYDLRHGDKLFEIGAGDGFLTCILSMYDADLTIYSNEIKQFLLEYAELNYNEIKEYVHLNEIVQIKGSKSNPNIPEIVDKVIIRNSFHHFSQKKKMLKNIHKALASNGELILLEIMNGDCELLMTKEEILNEIQQAGFNLVDEEIILNGILLKFIKT